MISRIYELSAAKAQRFRPRAARLKSLRPHKNILLIPGKVRHRKSCAFADIEQGTK
jgi:hypothetical protein